MCVLTHMCLHGASTERANNARAPQERLAAEMKRKSELRGVIEAQLLQQQSSCRDLERECAELVSKARHRSGKLMVRLRLQMLNKRLPRAQAVVLGSGERSQPHARSQAVSPPNPASCGFRRPRQPPTACWRPVASLRPCPPRS